MRHRQFCSQSADGLSDELCVHVTLKQLLASVDVFSAVVYRYLNT